MILLFPPDSCFGQGSSASPYAETSAYSSRQTDVFSFTGNQAALAALENIALGIYGEKRFLPTGLGQYQVVLGLPSASGNFGLELVYYGLSAYNEMKAGLAYGRKLGSKVSAGIQFNYNTVRIAGYGQAAALGFDAGILFQLSGKLQAGIHLSNPVGGKWANGTEKLTSVYAMGFGYDASEKFFLGMEILKREGQPVNLKAGLQYLVASSLLVRLGISTLVPMPWIGLGFLWKAFRFDTIMSYHPQLGMSPGLAVLYNLQSAMR